MNDLKKRIVDEIVRPEISKTPTTTHGHIVNLDSKHMMADVIIKHPDGRGQYILKKVPLQMGSGGLSQSGPFKGDKVIIAFKNNNILNPVITGLLETNFEQNQLATRWKHERKGSMCPDMICNRKDWTYSGDLYSGESNFDYLI